MWSEGSLLLLLLLLVASGSRQIDSTTDDRRGFDFELCKERLCLVNTGCSTIVDKTLAPHTTNETCKIVLAIWPYSEQKWRITIQTQDPTDALTLQIVDKQPKVKTTFASCVKMNGAMNVSTQQSGYSTELIRGSVSTGEVICEFFLHTTAEKVMSGLINDRDSLQLRYGSAVGEALDLILVDASVDFTSAFKPYKGLCNPDTINFDKSLSNGSQLLLQPVNSDRFALSCNAPYDMRYKDGSGLVSKVAGIACVKIGDNNYGYNITTTSGDLLPTLPNTKNFSAFCAVSACTQCTAVTCTSPDEPDSCPTFSNADLSNATSCATLTCSGDRFLINGTTTVVEKASCESTGWTIGTHTDVRSASCAKHVDCPPSLTCDESCSVTKDAASCKEEGLVLSANVSTRLSLIECDRKKGLWMQVFDQHNKTLLPLGTTNLTCPAPEVALKKGLTMANKHCIAAGLVSLYFITGITLCAFLQHKYGLGDTDNPRDTPQLQALVEREMAKMEKEEAEANVQQSGQNSTSERKTKKDKKNKSKEKPSNKSSDQGTSSSAPPTAPTQQPQQPSNASAEPLHTQQQPHVVQHMLQPSHAPPSTDYNDNQYEPIPGLEPPMHTAVGAVPPSAERVSAEPLGSGKSSAERLPQQQQQAAPPPPAAAAPAARPAARAATAADDQYELLPEPAVAPPPPPPPKKSNPDEEYVLFEPTNPPPHTPPGSQRRRQQGSGAAATEQTPPRASQYYANSKRT